MAAAQTAAKKRRRHFYMTVKRLIDPDTGALVGAFVPLNPVDLRTMRERKFATGKEYKIVATQSRNPKFYRLAHALGGFLADHVAGFEGLGQHDAIKRLQELSGIGCESVKYDLPGIGTIERKEAESLDFERMDETRFRELWCGANYEAGWVGWLRLEKFPALPMGLRLDVEEMISKEPL